MKKCQKRLPLFLLCSQLVCANQKVVQEQVIAQVVEQKQSDSVSVYADVACLNFDRARQLVSNKRFMSCTTAKATFANSLLNKVLFVSCECNIKL